MNSTLDAIDPFALPQSSIADFKNFPVVSCIYFVLDEKTIVYIGQAPNLRTRWKAHTIHSKVGKDAQVAWLECENLKLNDTEEFFYRKYSPVLNAPFFVRNHATREDAIEVKTHRVNLQLSPEAYKLLEDQARKENRNVGNLASFMLERIIKDAIESGIVPGQISGTYGYPVISPPQQRNHI